MELHALAYSIDDDGLHCLACTDVIISEYRALWFASFRPKRVMANDQCPCCKRMYNSAIAQQAAERIACEIEERAKAQETA